MTESAMKLILFDCDGTLTDSHGSIAWAMQQAFASHGFATPQYQDVLGIIGLSLAAAVEQLAPAGISQADKESVAASYSEHYRTTESNLRLYPQVIETLEELQQRGYLMGVVTGKSSRGLLRVMDTFDLHRFFPVWRTADICYSKPHPAMVQECMDEMGAIAEHTVVVGDSRFDIQMARAAGVRSIGVSFGVEPAQSLMSEGAEIVIDAFDELLDSFPRV